MPPATKRPDPNPAPDGSGWFRYRLTESRTYLFPDAPAVLAESGAVHRLPKDPGDGAWEPCEEPTQPTTEPGE